jgi:hypothetical protein
MDKKEKNTLINWQITMPVILIITIQILSLIWNMSSGAKNVENQIIAVTEKIKESKEKIKKNSDVIDAQIKTSNKIAIDTAILRVQSQNIQKQVSKIEDILKVLLIETRK